MTYHERFNKALEVGLLTRDDAAIESVAAQAEAIREALRRWGVREEDIQNELLEHGYIEPKTEDDENKNS